MKIRVSYAELKSGPGYENKRAECSIELEVNGDLNTTFEKAWKRCKKEVANQLSDKQTELFPDEDIPF